MNRIDRTKLFVLLLVFGLPLAFFGYFEWKKHKTGLRLEELPYLSQVPIPAFSLLTQKGNLFSREELTGKIVVADFFFTTCPGICRKMGQQMKRVANFFGTSAQFRSDWLIMSFTVNPEVDTPNRLREYAEEIGATTDKWIFLTGEKDSLYRLATTFFKLPVIQVGTDTLPEPFVHSERFVLLDKEGFIRGYYDGTDSLSVNKLMNDALLLDLHYLVQASKEKKRRIHE